jgi:hypothetical protein
MASKSKRIYNESKSKDKKRQGRITTSKPTQWHKDESKYSRKVKHKGDYDEGTGL